MSRLQILLIAFISVLLVGAGAGAGTWYYLYGAPSVSAAELVPADTLFFATIPNGVSVAQAYQTSHAQQLLSSPNMQPLADAINKGLGQKNLDLINAFVPNLSGQSFVAVTHIDPKHPENFGFVAAMKAKAGLGDFGGFLDKLKATYPDVTKGATTGKGNVEGVDYDWLQEKDAPFKLCVASVKGWVVTTLSEDSLRDFIQRLQKKAATPNLADDADYRSSLTRVGADPMTVLYFNVKPMMDFVVQALAKTNPAMSTEFGKKLKDYGGLMVASRFENGDIVDRYSFLIPRQAQTESGMSATPCAFDTLKFTSRNTRMYMGAGMDWKKYYASLKEQLSADPSYQSMLAQMQPVQAMLQQEGVDFEKNFIDALGSEFSMQLEWNDDTLFPETGLFLKLDKPEDFKPVITAVLDLVRKQLATTAVVKEESAGGHNFATLNILQMPMISPTITEDGDYFGLFLTANQAVRSFQRDPALTLASNEHFVAQIGDKRNGANQIIFLDSPNLLNRAYKTALPYISMAEMFNPQLASALQGKQLPSDLSWLAPIGTWSAVMKSDDLGVTGYSVSGVGNQIVFLYSGVVGVSVLEALGEQVKNVFSTINSQLNTAGPGNGPAPSPAPAPAPISPVPTPPNQSNVPTPPAPAPAPAPDQTNAAPVPAAAPAPAPDAATPPPAPAPATPPAPDAATNSPANATPPPPAPTQ